MARNKKESHSSRHSQGERKPSIFSQPTQDLSQVFKQGKRMHKSDSCKESERSTNRRLEFSNRGMLSPPQKLIKASVEPLDGPESLDVIWGKNLPSEDNNYDILNFSMTPERPPAQTFVSPQSSQDRLVLRKTMSSVSDMLHKFKNGLKFTASPVKRAKEVHESAKDGYSEFISQLDSNRASDSFLEMEPDGLVSTSLFQATPCVPLPEVIRRWPDNQNNAVDEVANELNASSGFDDDDEIRILEMPGSSVTLSQLQSEMTLEITRVDDDDDDFPDDGLDSLLHGDDIFGNLEPVVQNQPDSKISAQSDSSRIGDDLMCLGVTDDSSQCLFNNTVDPSSVESDDSLIFDECDLLNISAAVKMAKENYVDSDDELDLLCSQMNIPRL